MVSLLHGTNLDLIFHSFVKLFDGYLPSALDFKLLKTVTGFCSIGTQEASPVLWHIEALGKYWLNRQQNGEESVERQSS